MDFTLISKKLVQDSKIFSEFLFRLLKADSHIACRSHAVPLPCYDSAVSFVKVRMVAGNIRTASPTV
jgi:hypothetical protein